MAMEKKRFNFRLFEFLHKWFEIAIVPICTNKISIWNEKSVAENSTNLMENAQKATSSVELLAYEIRNNCPAFSRPSISKKSHTKAPTQMSWLLLMSYIAHMHLLTFEVTSVRLCVNVCVLLLLLFGMRRVESNPKLKKCEWKTNTIVPISAP